VQSYKDCHDVPCKLSEYGGDCRFPLSGKDATTKKLVLEVVEAMITKTNTTLYSHFANVTKAVDGDLACLKELVCAEMKAEVVGSVYDALCGDSTTAWEGFPATV